ncbi:MAG: MBL fold metallo-hydrolase RNA specificity domain-containing protein [Candidatus Binatia bacterium]
MAVVVGGTLQFLGAAGTVTGSKYMITTGANRILLECGLFQGLKGLRVRNWAPPPYEATSIGAVVLSHAHLDHSGYLPLLVRRGFRGPVHCSAGTADLVRILLLDAAHLQEEDAERANRRGYTRHKPALPLYTTADAEAAIGLLSPESVHQPFRVASGVEATFHDAGHILGASIVDLSIAERGRGTRLVFSGDLGRWGRPLVPDPELVAEADTLLVESTYGDRTHPSDAEDVLARLVCETAQAHRVLLVPAFAVGRTQELLYILRRLEDAGRIPALPVFLDSPMAIEVTGIYLHHLGLRDGSVVTPDGEAGRTRPSHARLLRSPEESKSLNELDGPMIVISASGMATGGRILHHLRRRLPSPDTTILLAGFQAAGTRGRALQDGARSIRIHGEDVPVRAPVVVLDGLSAHADADDLLRWARGFKRPPTRVYVVHGEPQPADRLAATLRAQLGWNARVAEDGETVNL